MGALVLVHEATGLPDLVGALVPVRLAFLIPVDGTNRDQWASLLAHHHWSLLVDSTGTKGWSLVPVQAINRDQ